MNPLLFQGQKLRNLLHSFVLFGAMAALLAWIGSLVFGGPGPVVLAAAFVLLTGLGTGLAPQWVMRLSRARPLGYEEAPRLYENVRQLATHAGLERLPQLYYVPSPIPNAFATGGRRSSAVALSDGLLRRLGPRELTGVLAHEVSHVKNGDLKIMAVAAMMGRMTETLAFFGQILLLLSLPMALAGSPILPWTTILLLLAAPTLAALLLQALSRTREYQADLDATRLTGDPEGLARALLRLEKPASLWQRLLFPYRREKGSPWLRSHPATAERVRRLRSLAKRPTLPPTVRDPWMEAPPPRVDLRRPRHFFHFV